MFSTLKYVNATNFEEFRKRWNAEYIGGFIVPSKSFDGLNGNFPIGFLVWQTSHSDDVFNQISNIAVEVLDKDANPIGEKSFYNLPASGYLNLWMGRPKPNTEEVIPLKNTVSTYTAKRPLSKWSSEAIAYMWCQNNDMQHVLQQTVVLSSVWGDGHGFYINSNNLWKAVVIFSVRHLIKHTWSNHNDQFLQPTRELGDEFKNDCLVHMLFHGKNLTASANDLEWDGKKWSIVNHFIPYTESEVGAPERFESDFMVKYMADKEFSEEAKAVLEAGKALWKAYFEHTDPHTVREELKLNRADVGWYQIRKALEARNKSGDYATVSFDTFKTAYQALTEKLRPQVYTLGFLKE
jgi:hypothetical protein